MAKKSSSSGGSELNLDSLMDAVTNVVGVLMIVFVVMALNTARIVQKILSDLPPVTEQEHKEMKDKIEALPPPAADPKRLDDEQVRVQTELKKIVEELKTVDTTELQQKMKTMDLDTYRKQLEDRKKDREVQKAATDKLLAEVERLKALLDQTPVYQPPPPKYVRLPNPRPYPEKPNETRVLVAKQGVLSFNQPKFLQPILDGMEKVKSQLEYQRVEYAPFAKLMEKILGPSAQQAWTDIASLVNRMQLEHVAEAYKILATGGLTPTKQILEAVADISIPTRSTMPVVAEAIVAATKANLDPWKKLDPSRDPLTPVIKAVAAGGKVTFSWGAKSVEVKATPKDIADYFFKELGKMKGIEDASKARTVYDMTRIVALLQRAAANPLISGSYTFEPEFQPSLAYVRLALKPKSGGGETIEALKQPNSAFIRLLRDVKEDPNGVVLFQVMPDAFDAYLEARKIADEVGVAATWDFLAKLDLTVNLTTYEIQRLEPAPVRKAAPGGTAPVGIAPPKKTLD
ncbi:MAG: hypothetical protein JNG86_10780 [Verrucomicrobiaceae bacterium]|nr:hypothetical protein [Verrucomicrobiaceae bacterium]